jgi:iron complex outermembrane receptor protein
MSKSEMGYQMRVTGILRAGAALWLLGALAAPAAAQQGDDPLAQRVADDDIVVIGTHERLKQPVTSGALGEKSLLDTPFSATVVDKDEIAKRQATSIGQIFINDPGVFSYSSPGTTNWWGTQIRGIGVNNFYIDDVPLLLYWGGDFPLEPVETVQAMKGLTGFMYGFGSPGGAILYQTKRPTAQPLLTTELGYRNPGVRYGQIDAGGPVGDGRLGYRLNLAGEQGTAYTKAGVNRWVGSLALDYAITPDLRWHVTATHEESKLEHEPFHVYWSQYEGTDLPSPDLDFDNVNVENSYYRTRTTSVATGLDWDMAEDWTAKLNYGYAYKKHQSNKMFIYMLNQAGDYQGYAYNFAETDQGHFGQAMVQGKVETGPIRHELVAGVSLQRRPSDFGNGYHWGNDFNGNIYQEQNFLVTRDIDYSTNGNPSEDRQTALFVSDTLHFGPQWQAIIGARRTRYKALDFDGDPTVDSGYRTTATTPTLALIYKPVEYVSLYGSYVESMEAGTRVGGDYANAGEILGATISKQYESGVKYEHQSLSLTAAAFRVERANQIDTETDGLRYLSQDGLNIYKGVEFSGSYRVTSDLRLGLGALHLDPKIDKVSAGNEALEGNTPAEASRWQLLANADYQVPSVEGLRLHGNVRYFGKAPVADDNALYMPSRVLANVGFQYSTSIAGRRADITGNINNLFNKKYWSFSSVGETRNASLSVKFYW